MKWEKIGKIQVAKGKVGKFLIERVKPGVYKASYSSIYFAFTLPFKKSIKDLKAMCEKNHYWED
jgi:hypothetical protein